MQDWVVSFPAWNTHYVHVCRDYAIPALMAAASHLPSGHNVRLLIHTDKPHWFPSGLPAEFLPVPNGINAFAAFTAAHREVIRLAPVGANVVLLNADIVASRELLTFADSKFNEGYRALPMVGTRSLHGNPPPIGVSARELSEWAWANRHTIAEECIWPTGNTRLPTVIFFRDGNNVVEHAFHYAPVVFRRDGRSLEYEGTSDYDLLERFTESETFYPLNLECSLAELSIPGKTFGHTEQLNVQRMARFGHRRFRPSHLESFKHGLLISGNRETVDTSPVAKILHAIRNYVPEPSPPPRRKVYK